MYCLLEYVFQDDKNRRKFVVTKFAKEDFFTFSQEQLDEKELVQIVSEGNSESNFFIRNGYLNWEGKTVPVPDISMLRTTKKVFTNKLPGLYELLAFLAVEEGLFVSSDSDEGVVPCTKICISKSNMDIYFGRPKDGHWDINYIIKNVGGYLEYNRFKFVIAGELPKHMLGFANLIGKKVVGGFTYNLYESSEDLLIYPLMEPQMYVSSALINLKSYQSELYGAGISMLNILLRTLADEPEEPSLSDLEMAKVEFSKYGVSIKVDVPKTTRSELVSMIKLINMNVVALSSGKIIMEDLISEVSDKFPGELHIYAFRTALAALLRESYSELDKLNSMDATRTLLMKQQVLLDLELYMYRSILYVSDHEYEFGKSVNGIFEYSGWAPYTTRLTKIKA